MRLTTGALLGARRVKFLAIGSISSRPQQAIITAGTELRGSRMLLRKVWRGRRWKEGCEEQRTCGRSMGGIPRGANASCSWFTIGMSSFSGIFGDFRAGLPVFSASLPSSPQISKNPGVYSRDKREESVFANRAVSPLQTGSLILAANGATTPNPNTLTHRSTNTRTTQPLSACHRHGPGQLIWWTGKGVDRFPPEEVCRGGSGSCWSRPAIWASGGCPLGVWALASGASSRI